MPRIRVGSGAWNVLAGKIRAREGGTFAAKTNLTDVTSFEAWY
ncbi:MAG: hypothetical protein ABW252_24070 [Polyangiales bacterium]